MYNDDGTIAIEGFNDGLNELTKEERNEIADAVKGFDEAAALTVRRHAADNERT
jgi:hypothetical protein